MAITEFRQNIVSGEWVLFATGRKRPLRQTSIAGAGTTSPCPFDDLAMQEIVWTEGDIIVIKNKFPAVIQGVCSPMVEIGPFQTHQATGEHDVLVYRNHDMRFSDFTNEQLVNAIRAFKRRYLEIAQTGDCTQYIHIFHNSGHDAGASIEHPHSQIISTPILPPDIYRSFHGAFNFFKKHGKKVFDVMLAWEMEQGKRIVYENDFFVAFCPYVSKYPYEVRIFAKEGHAHFEKMPEALDPRLADALGIVLKKIAVVLDNPAYNFFIHTAPAESSLRDLHEFYSWHVEILPKFKIDAGVEIGTGFGVNVIDPDEAAAELREAKI
ncbi:MAG: hypothetical protein AAB452_02665 [Patescibacteria group bacterium]